MKERNYLWYVEPLNSHTNGVFSRMDELRDATNYGIRCSDRRPRNLYLCDSRQTVQSLWDSREDQHLDLRIYNAFIPKGGSRNAKIRECTFLFRGTYKLRKKQQKTKAAKATPKMVGIPF